MANEDLIKAFDDETDDGLEGITVVEDDESPAVSNDHAISKAKKTHLGLADASPGEESLYSSTISRQDNHKRRELIETTKLGSRERTLGLVNNYLDLRKQNEKAPKVTDGELDYLMNLSDKEEAELISDPQTFFEKSYAKYLTKSTVDQSEAYRKALLENPTAAQEVKLTAERAIAKKESFNELLAERANVWKEAGAVSTTLNVVGQLVPFVSWWNTQSRTDGPTSSFLQGSNIKEQIVEIWLKPHDEAVALAKKVLEDIGSRSKLDALRFAQALLSYSESEVGVDNLISAVDVGTSGALGAVKGITKSLIKSTSGSTATSGPVSQSRMAMALGDIKTAGRTNVAEELTQQADKVRGNVNSLGEIKKDIPTIFDVDGVMTGIPNHAAVYSNRLKETLAGQADLLLKAGITNPLNITRLDGAALDVAMKEAEKSVFRTYTHLPDTVVNVEPRLGSNTPFGVDQIIVQFGKHDGSLFKDEATAEMIGRHVFQLPDGGWNVAKVGDHFAIEVVKNVDETLPSIRNALAVQTKGDKSVSMVNMAMGFIRGNDYVVPKKIAEAFKTSTYGGNQMFEAYKTLGRNFSALGKGRADFESFVSAQQKFVDPSDPTRIGKFSNDMGEFTKDWSQMYNRAPTEAESLAYFTYKQMNDIEYAVNNLGIYRDKARLGLQNLRVTVDGVKSPKIEGKEVDGIPWGNQENTGILILEDTAAGSTAGRKDFMFSTRRQEIDDLIASGQYKVTQITSNGEQAVRSIPGLEGVLQRAGDITFVVSKKSEYSPLDFKQLPYRPGGHVMYEDGFFIKQGKINRTVGAGGRTENLYNGDVSIFNFQNRAQAIKFAGLMDEARLMLKNNGPSQALKAFVTKNLPMEYQDFTRMFSENGPLSLNQRIVATGNGQSVDDIVNYSATLENFRKRSESSYNLFDNVNLRNAQERGTILNTIVEGTPTNPLVHTRQAEVINPITALNRSSVDLMRGRYMDNVKHRTSEQFIAQFRDVLDLSDSRFDTNPLLALLEAPIKSNTSDKALAAAARTYRRRAKEFFGVKTEFHNWWDNVRWNIADGIYERLGQKGVERTPGFLLASEKDPVKFFRSVAFHSKLGMFNPVQLFQQAQTMVNVIGITGPARGLSAGMTGNLMRIVDVNPSMVDKAGDYAKAWGWTKEDFVESYTLMKDSGFSIVGKEATQIDDYFDVSVADKTGFGRFLEAGTFFFREGEALTRRTAWNAAYQEWKAANKGRKVDNLGAQEILARADLLTVNMSRASQASWQQGLLSVPTQFMSYQVRLMEQFIGGTLTTSEKLRLFATMSAAYGAPVAASSVVGGVWPLHEEIKGALMKNGIDVEESLIVKTVNDGLLSMAQELIQGDRQNTGERLGPSGIPLFRDLLRGDKGVLEMFGGVSGTTTADMLAKSFPVVSSIVGMFSGEDDWYPVLERDLIDFASSISSVNQGRQAFNALFLNEYITRSGIKITDQSAWSGLMNAMIGTSPQAITDMFRQIDLNKDLQKHQQEVTKEITKLWGMMLNAEDDDTRASLGKRIKLEWIRGGFTPFQARRVLRDMGSSQEHLYPKFLARQLGKTPEQNELYIKKIRRNNQRSKELNSNDGR